MKIVLLEPFFTGSHKRWALGFQKHSRHEVEVLSLSGRHWKWRMHGGAVSLAKKYAQVKNPDLLLATDMIDFASFLALTRQHPSVPTAIYFHENQLTYPWSPTDQDVALKRDNHYAWINYTSVLVADKVFFNSAYHKNSFLQALPQFLKQFPDHQEISGLIELEKKCTVLSLGMDLPSIGEKRLSTKRKNILWNHRWEYDKNPAAFFELLFRLADEGIDFGLIVTGEQYKNSPAIFAEAKRKLAKHMLHFGFVESKNEYLDLLQQADILPVTSNQDFFGGSVVEAIAAGVLPLLPNRLAYPEHIPTALQDHYIYQSAADLYSKLKHHLTTESLPTDRDALQSFVKNYSWPVHIKIYDAVFQEMIM